MLSKLRPSLHLFYFILELESRNHEKAEMNILRMVLIYYDDDKEVLISITSKRQGKSNLIMIELRQTGKNKRRKRVVVVNPRRKH